MNEEYAWATRICWPATDVVVRRHESGKYILRKEKELQFRRLTAKLSFYGTRSADMYGLVGVRNIRNTQLAIRQGTNGLVVPTA